MKKIYALFICTILMIAVATAAVIEMPVKPAIAHMGTMIIGGGVPSGEAPETECPSYYADAILSWDGDHSSGTNIGCESDEDTVTFTNESATISTTYGEGAGDIGMLIDGSSVGLHLTQTADQYIDDDGAQTLWARIYMLGTIDASTIWLGGYYDSTERIRCYLRTNDELRASILADGTNYSVNSGTVSYTVWVDVAFSYDFPNDDIAVYYGSWTESLDALTGDFSDKLNEVVIGTYGLGGSSPGAGNELYITKYALVSGYKAAKPW